MLLHGHCLGGSESKIIKRLLNPVKDRLTFSEQRLKQVSAVTISITDSALLSFSGLEANGFLLLVNHRSLHFHNIDQNN